jgi:hypothetical protein
MTLVMSSLILSLRSKPLEWIFPANCDLLLHQAVRRASRPHRPVARQYFQSLRSKPLEWIFPANCESAPTSGGSARESASPPSSASIFPVASLQTAHEPSPATCNYAPLQVARRPHGTRDLVFFLRYVDWLQTTKGQSLPLTKEEQGIRLAFNRNRILRSFVFPSCPLWLKGSDANAPDKTKKRRGLRNH